MHSGPDRTHCVGARRGRPRTRKAGRSDRVPWAVFSSIWRRCHTPLDAPRWGAVAWTCGRIIRTAAEGRLDRGWVCQLARGRLGRYHRLGFPTRRSRNHRGRTVIAGVSPHRRFNSNPPSRHPNPATDSSTWMFPSSGSAFRATLENVFQQSRLRGHWMGPSCRFGVALLSDCPCARDRRQGCYAPCADITADA